LQVLIIISSKIYQIAPDAPAGPHAVAGSVALPVRELCLEWNDLCYRWLLLVVVQRYAVGAEKPEHWAKLVLASGKSSL